MYKGLLCDLDGTLADSEPLHCRAWLALLEEEQHETLKTEFPGLMARLWLRNQSITRARAPTR